VELFRTGEETFAMWLWPGQAGFLMRLLNKAGNKEGVRVLDETATSAALAVVGPMAGEVVKASFGDEAVNDLPLRCWRELKTDIGVKAMLVNLSRIGQHGYEIHANK